MSDVGTELPEQVPDKLYFRIGEVGDLVGVEPHVLRYWEGEFRMRPHRSSSGQRLYRKKDIARFLKIKKLLHTEGFTIAGARKALSGGGAPSTKNGAQVDTDKLREAADRITGLRANLSHLRESVRGLEPL
ncbi:MAG: MerR family transcriptional regulator [Proteobacteria bacterium]|nr:MerR family transcriptional regulator [Pseudomonadota bacterium]MCP4919123.1 MerR family transcriptional regulator [Pseudomonadota bacterium]